MPPYGFVILDRCADVSIGFTFLHASDDVSALIFFSALRQLGWAFSATCVRQVGLSYGK